MSFLVEITLNGTCILGLAGEMAEDTQEERLLTPEFKDDLKTRVWVELKKIWRVSFPSMLAKLSSFGMILVTQAYIGHIGETQLAAYALIQTIGNRFANGIIV